MLRHYAEDLAERYPDDCPSLDDLEGEAIETEPNWEAIARYEAALEAFFVAPAVTIRRRSCGRACGHRSSGSGTGNGKGGGDGGDGDGDGDSDEDSQNTPLTKRPVVWLFVAFCGFLWACESDFCQGHAFGCYNKSGEPTPKGLSTPPRGDAKCCRYP